MMQKIKNQSGFGHLLLVVCAALVLGVVGFAGYRVMNNSDELASGSTKTADTNAPATIESTDDLTQTQDAVDQTNVDSDLNPSDLDQDVDSLL